MGKEFSKFYFINSENEEQYKEATKPNKKSDEFYHSIFVKSQYFDKGDVTENVVVELKRPTVALGEKELSQVKNICK